MSDSTAKNASTSPEVGWSTLLRLAWPLVLARATQALIGFTDALMVAPLGKESLAATTTGGLNAFAFIILPMGTAFIVQSFTSQLRGTRRARRGAKGRALRPRPGCFCRGNRALGDPRLLGNTRAAMVASVIAMACPARAAAPQRA
ncbi:MAG TPA: MATE family efflux transporter [Polyangiaceae bacterium]|nr:MATE family efflux transporter [Polyangiaceae bacterium]